MDRRDFLIGATGALAAGSTGCASLGELIVPKGDNIPPADMERFLGQLDSAMNNIARAPASGGLLDGLDKRRFKEKEARLFRQGMRALLLAGNLGDLSVAGQTHPGVQQRLRYSSLEMDQAVSGLTARMASLSPAARANIKTALRQDPGLADRALEAIEMEATNVGVPIRRRLQLRVMGKQIARRLRQSPDMLIDEYITKCRKAAAQSGTSAQVQRHTAAQLGPETLKTRVEETETAIQHWQTLGVGEGLIGYQLLEGEGADGSALRGGSGPRKKKYNQKEKVKGAKRKSVVLPKRPRVRVITPEIRRSLFGTSWIQGSCMSVDEKMLVLKEEGVNSVLKIPLASITAFGVIREPGGLQDQWEQVALPIPQTLLDELAERAERTTQAERDALLKHAAYGYSTEPSDGWYNVGGWLFGFGLITTTVGWILILLGDGTGADALLVPGVIFGVTIGPLSVLGALLILLLGAMIDIGDGTSQPRQEQ